MNDFRAAADQRLVGGGRAGRRSPEIINGLNNLIQNAVQYARDEVSVTTHWDRTMVTVEDADDGPGFPPNLL
ncbi:MAG TPA: hypothetical protein VHG31_08605, partial [Stellaceae bacterium]|nr:hypothetical protein [Stellaceae bacterium]